MTQRTGVGIDGCRAGWVWCRRSESGWDGGLVTTLIELRPIIESSTLALIDMPIGLVSAGQEERACDRAARALLGRPRASSVFRPPCRAALAAPDYPSACDINRRHTGVALSLQTWNIAAKIRELDGFLRTHAELPERLREAHPELCLWGLAGGQAMRHNKRTREGRRERLQLLGEIDTDCFPTMDALAGRHPRRALAHDDILDAAVLACTAILTQRAAADSRRLPAAPEVDAHGLPMQLVFCER